MQKLLLILSGLFIWCSPRAQTVKGTHGERFTQRILADHLSDPWEITYGPDHHLWVTEAKGYRILRIDPESGIKDTMLDINDQRLFQRPDTAEQNDEQSMPWPQGGLMGMALHPSLLKDMPYVYIAYIYRFNGKACLEHYGGCFFTTRIARYTYDSLQHKLHSPVIISDEIPGSNDHNGGRLTIAPVNEQLYLFYTTGDMGAGQFSNAARSNHAQDTAIWEGKILRFNTTTDKKDNWIPVDNPFNTAEKRNAVWSYGHRNPQGITCARINGKTIIYSCEHGAYSDDEINIIEKGKNYGHPLVQGYADGNYNSLAASVNRDTSLPGLWNTSYPLIEDEKDNARKIGIAYRDPIFSFFPSSHKFLDSLMHAILEHGLEKMDWPSVAPSSIDYYSGNGIPGWKNSLLITTLKAGTLFRLPMKEDGTKPAGKPIAYFTAPVRYRDVAISPDGKRIFLAVDSTTNGSGPARYNPRKVAYNGVILEFKYERMDK